MLLSRRKFLNATAATGVAAGFPIIIPASVLSQFAPSRRINVGAIGIGRISRAHDLPGILPFDGARVMAVCDLDASRLAAGKEFVNAAYAKKTGKAYDGVTGYDDFRPLLANPDIDAVVISTPDHQHAAIALATVRAGKDVYLQKPASLTIAEGRYLSNAVQASGRIVQIGSQQRSWTQFRYAAELVRNGRIGQLKHVEIGLPVIPPGQTRHRCRCRRASNTMRGSAPRPTSTTPRCACILRWALIAPVGCGASSLVRA
jgi:hypothetical protein